VQRTAFPAPVVILLVTSVAAMAAVRAADPRPDPDAEPPSWARIEVRAGNDRRTLEGEIVVEARDGGLLLELADERYEALQPDAILARMPLPALPAGETPRELGRRILAELPAGFDVHVTRHYVVCFDTSREYAKWCAALFERLHEAFGNFWDQAGFELRPPARPFIVVIFADRKRYEQFAARDLGAAADRVVGYYNLMSNRVTTFDLTGSDALAAGGSRRAGLDILASPEAAALVATLVHEATHQMAFNCGMHRRLAPVPLWLSEGIATYFEAPDLTSSRGWRGIGTVNSARFEHFQRTYQPGMLARVVVDDEAFRGADAVDAYAAAWALTYFLAQTRKPQLVAYLRTLAGKRPLAADSAEERLRDFEAAFAAEPRVLEDALLKYMARLRPRP
jgi:hypothetical protein